MNDRRKWLAGAGLFACLAVGGAVSATSDEDPSPAPEPEVAGADAPPVDRIEPDQAAEIGQLRRPRTSDDELPARWEETLVADGDDSENFGANPELSRHTAPGVWIVPGDDYVCLANTASGEGALGFGCATPEDVDRGLLAPSDVDANGNGVLTGVVPDGVASVTLIDKDGSKRSVEVARNTYQAAIDGTLKEVRFRAPDGGVRVLPMAWNR